MRQPKLSPLERPSHSSAGLSIRFRPFSIRSPISRDIVSRRDEHLSLAAIARRWGLMDERNFRRAFMREFGCAPSALRDGTASVPSPGSIGADLQRWFLGL